MSTHAARICIRIAKQIPSLECIMPLVGSATRALRLRGEIPHEDAGARRRSPARENGEQKRDLTAEADQEHRRPDPGKPQRIDDVMRGAAREEQGRGDRRRRGSAADDLNRHRENGEDEEIFDEVEMGVLGALRPGRLGGDIMQRIAEGLDRPQLDDALQNVGNPDNGCEAGGQHGPIELGSEGSHCGRRSF